METTRDISRFSVVAGVLLAMSAALPAHGQTIVTDSGTAADAALEMANTLDGAGGGVSREALISALEGAAAAGQPMALWQLGMMYENGEGVEKDPVKAFSYFSQIASEHADTPPRGLEADIVAQSFVKVGEYYQEGLPDAGIPANAEYSHELLLHAATYFGDADAQYRVGKLYLEENELGVNPLLSARWFLMAARKGHGPAQASLGELLFNGIEGIEPQPVEGLMWMTMAREQVAGTVDEVWVTEKLNAALATVSPEQRAEATQLAAQLAPQINGL